jgi:hypothetical protein
MAIFRVNPEDLEQFTIITNPIRTYSSSSKDGVTGSIYVHARRSDIEKEIAPLSSFVEATHDDSDLSIYLKSAQSEARKTPGESNLFASLSSYMEKVSAQGVSARKNKVLDVIRFTPSVNFSSNTLRKLIVKDILNDYYRVMYPSAHWAYSNYNSLNFFTASTVPPSSVLLYPNTSGSAPHVVDGYESGIYNLNGPFSFDFHINPRYNQDTPDQNFHAGTIFHLSSSYCLSLVTGSAKDHNGKSTGFRMLLQLSHSADISPSKALPGQYPNDLVFMSDDNSLSHNHWHHVVVRWGTDQINFGTGSFNIDGVDKGIFVIPSGTTNPQIFDPSAPSDPNSPEVLCVGNYWEGSNADNDSMSYFFAKNPSTRDGLVVLDDDEGPEEPAAYEFSHPLNAELHDLCIKRYYVTNEEIFSSSYGTPTVLDDRIAFYCPPFFTEQSPFRQFVGNYGGIPQTPFFAISGSTNDPFNVAMAFGCNGHYINLENFVRDFANDTYPRLHHMTASVTDETTSPLSANEYLYSSSFVRRRNLTIMPCDDGKFIPNYNLLANEINNSKFIDDLSVEELSYISLNNLLSTDSLLFGTTFDDVDGVSSISASDFVNELIGPTPEDPTLPPGPAYQTFVNGVSFAISEGAYDPGIQAKAPLTIYQRTRDPSSNQVTFFDISNLYYGKQIKPGSFSITDHGLSGSSGKVKITLRDDGQGNLYRADSDGPHATWNSCGNIYYSEGIVVVKNPHLYFYGKESYEMSFRGEQNIHALKMEILAPANMLNSSSNPSYIPGLSASGDANDTDPDFVYITGINFHDDNLNLVAKTQLAQPIVKRFGDKIMFKVTLDF